MRGNRLLMVMPYRQLVAKAVDAGFRVYSIWDPALESPAYLDDVAERSEAMALTDFADEAELRRLVSTMAARHQVSHVLHLGREATQLAVCDQAQALGLSLNPPRSVAQINDKAAMRRLLRERGLSPVLSFEARTPCEARQLLRRGLDRPMVVKPTRLDGSQGVRLIEYASDLDAWRDELDRLGYRGPVLVEEHLKGREFSVETLAVHGRHEVVGITAKLLGPPPRFVEMGHVYPAPLDDESRQAISDMVLAYLEATGYRFGPAHTEVILTQEGPRIVESQARLGGDRIPLLIELATGFDIEAAVFAALAGRPIKPGPARRVAHISFFDFGSGCVQSVHGADEVLTLPFIHALKLKVAPGDALTPVSSSQTRHGYVAIEAATAHEAAQRAAIVRDVLRVVTTRS